ncbi:Trehalose transport system permease protein SugB [compost metagenome]
MSVILSYTAFNMPITIMILLGAYYALPREIEEAAVMDGCSVNRMFFVVVLPMTISVLTTTVIINMIYNWNEFIFVNTFISSDHLKTLTVGVQNFVGQYSTDWGAIGATLVISMLPIVVAFFILSEQIMEGVTAGAVKG